MKRCIAIIGALLLTVAASGQLAETFVGDWTTSFGTQVNRVAPDPNDPQQFYGLLDARKLQAELENYSVVVKYNCRGQFAWTRALEGGDSTRQLVDMEVHKGNGKIGVLHADDSRFILQWLRSGGTPIGNVEVDRNPNWLPLDLAADPNRPRWYILYRDNTGVLGHFGLMVIDEMGGLQQTWQSDRVAFGKARLEVLPSGELLLGANGRMYLINAGTGQVEGWSWAGDDPLNIDFSAWEADAYFAEWTDSGLRLTQWTTDGPQQQWLAQPELFPGSVSNLQIATNANSWALMADLSMGGGATPIGLLQGQRNSDFSSLLTPDVFAINGHIALDADDRLLYSGSIPGGADDHLFRLDAANPCVEVTTPGATWRMGTFPSFRPFPFLIYRPCPPIGKKPISPYLPISHRKIAAASPLFPATIWLRFFAIPSWSASTAWSGSIPFPRA